MTITGQPNVAVGFLDTNTSTLYPYELALVESASVNASVALDCSADGTLQLLWSAVDSSDRPQVLWSHGAKSSAYRWRAASHPGHRWLTSVSMVDIMYETRFDGGDVLGGTFELKVANSFLESKFGWVAGSSTMGSLIAATSQIKRSTGRCPMLSQSYRRSDDLGGAHLEHAVKRTDFLYQTTIDDLNGVPDTSNHEFNQLTWLVKMQEKDDAMYLTRHHFADMDLLRDRLTCLAPRYVFESVPPGLQRSEGYQYETCRRLTMSEYDRDEFEGSDGQSRLHDGLHSSGGVDSALFDYPPTQSKEDHRKFKAFLMRLMPPNTGFGKNNGWEPPNLSAKFERLGAKGQLNISHTFEMVISLGTTWVTGLPMADHTAIGIAQSLKCKDNTLYNREMQSRRGGLPRDAYTRRFAHCDAVDWKNPRNGITRDLKYHYKQAPIADLVRQQNAETWGNFLDLYSSEMLSDMVTQQLGFLATQIEAAARQVLEDDEIKAHFKRDPEKALLEIFRLGTPSSMSTTLVDTKKVNVSYVKRQAPDAFGDSERSGILYAGTGLLERYALYQANRDPRAFQRPNTFDPERPDWHKSLVFGAPLDLFYEIDPATNVFPGYNMSKMLGVDRFSAKDGHISRYYCPGQYMSMGIAAKVVGAILESEEAKYVTHREQCLDNEREAQRLFGESIYPEYSVCANAMARIDGRYEKGVGCQLWSGMCCRFCSQLDVDSKEYVQLVRMTMMRTSWFPDQFRWTGIPTYKYFLATQRYWSDTSLVEVTPTGKKNYYKGPEAIMEYYSLQNEYFNPPSYRVSVSTYNLTKHHFPKWDAALDDGKRIHSWNFDPAQTLGVNLVGADPPYDFSQFVWEDTTSIYPLKGAYHDFRQPTHEWIASGKPSNMVDGFGEAEELCHLIQERCVGNFSQFDSFKSCYEYMAQVPKFKIGYCPPLAGNTLSCRWTHAILSHEKMRPDYHCYHLGRADWYDPNGKYKCHDSECGHEKAGPIECGPETCDRTWMSAGKWVDHLHVVYWGLVFLVLVHARYSLRKHIGRLQLIHSRFHDSWDATAAETATLDSLRKVYPIVIGGIFVTFFFFLTFLIVTFARPSFLWRPWPAESIAPRFSETHHSSTTRKARYWYADYAGENTEPLLSHLNLYQDRHLLFYLFFTATVCLVLALEWLGARFHARCSGWLSFDMSHLGHAGFTAFVFVSLYFPQSSFSYVIFCIGVTKCLYPEIHLTLWFAFVKHEVKAAVRYEMTKQWRTDTRDSRHSAAGIRGSFKKAAGIVIDKAETLTGLDLDGDGKVGGVAVRVQMLNTSLLVDKMSAGSIASENIDLNVKKTTAFFIHFFAGCGLMLHHISLIIIFCASSLHLLFTEDYAFAQGLSGVIFLVLVQHVLSQVVMNALIQAALLVVVEIYFQWFAISAMSESGSSLGCVGTLGLMASHYFMAAEVPYMVYKAIKDESSETTMQEVCQKVQARFSGVVNKIETATGLDINGDGSLGGKGPAPSPSDPKAGGVSRRKARADAAASSSSSAHSDQA